MRKTILILATVFAGTASADCLYDVKTGGCSVNPVTVNACRYLGASVELYLGFSVGYLCRDSVGQIDYWKGSSEHYERYANEYLRKLNALKKKCGKRCR